MYNRIKRNIKTAVLWGIAKTKRSGHARTPCTGTTVTPTRVFVEIGTGQSAEWTYLVRDDWREVSHRKQKTEPLRALPPAWTSVEGNWHGYLVEAHPSNFSALVEKTVTDKKIKPFLHRLTFINAAISEASQLTTMGIETGALKGLFVNRFTLREALPFHPSAIDNSHEFGLFTVSLEMLCAAIRHEHIDLLRMDVEGAEVPILNAYRWLIKPTLLSVEYHSSEARTFLQRILAVQEYRVDAQNGEEIRGIQKTTF